jgi:hypothetical protein
MPGRITDELKRITRQQGGVETPAGAPSVREPPGRRHGPIIALAVVVLLVGAGWLLVDRLMNMSRTQDCIMSGRKNCAPLDTGH